MDFSDEILNNSPYSFNSEGDILHPDGFLDGNGIVDVGLHGFGLDDAFPTVCENASDGANLTINDVPKSRGRKPKVVNTESKTVSTTSPSRKGRKRKLDEIEKDNSRLQFLQKKSSLTPEEKEELRILRNRKTAQLSREKKRRKMQEKNDRITYLESRNSELERENSDLGHRMKEMQMELTSLRQEVNSYREQYGELKSRKVMVMSFFAIVFVCVFLLTSLVPSPGANSIQPVSNHHSDLEPVSKPPRVIHQLPSSKPNEYCTPRTLDDDLTQSGLNTSLLISDYASCDEVVIPDDMKKHFPDVSVYSTKTSKGAAFKDQKAVVSKTFQKGFLYNHDTEEKVYLFSPYLYPLLGKKSDVVIDNLLKKKIVIVHPVEVFNKNNTDQKLYRLHTLETSGGVSFGDSFFSFSNLKESME